MCKFQDQKPALSYFNFFTNNKTIKKAEICPFSRIHKGGRRNSVLVLEQREKRHNAGYTV